MDFRIIKLADTIVYGVSGRYEGQGYKTREELRHSMWANNCDDVPVSFVRAVGTSPVALLTMAYGMASGRTAST